MLHPIESGLELLGWSETPRSIFHPEQLVFLNEEQRIIGFGSKLPDNLPPGFVTLNTPSSLAWIGFANLTIPSKSLAVYRIEKNGRSISRVGEAISLQDAEYVKSVESNGGNLLPQNGNWVMNGPWQKNGKLPSPPRGEAPHSGYFDDWKGGNSASGELVSPLISPSNACITIPLAHGPSTGNLEVQIEEAATSSRLALLPMWGGDLSWRYFQIGIPASVSQVRIVAKDQGRDGGEWLAIGEARSCQFSKMPTAGSAN